MKSEDEKAEYLIPWVLLFYLLIFQRVQTYFLNKGMGARDTLNVCHHPLLVPSIQKQVGATFLPAR